LIELLLTTRYSEVHGGAVGYFAVVVEEPHVTANQGGETDEIL
jgi:hypothetical protein